jgi:hypothetical protein
MLAHFKGSLLFTIAALAIAAWLGWSITGNVPGMLGIVWICVVLAILEVSLSFDNAAVNATVLKDMDPKWQGRFLTWGVAIAVFGMRIIFPLIIVAIAASLDPISAFRLAIDHPHEYARILSNAHIGLMGFGGAFLGMVGMKYFFDSEKEVSWIEAIEEPLKKVAAIEAIEIAVLLLAMFFTSRQLDPVDAHTFLLSGIFGLVSYIGVEIIGHALEAPDETTGLVVKSGLASFLYLEVLDASFSFDGVIGAFALSTNLFIIAIGLGIGAMFVRSLTIYLVKKGTLSEYRFLEHGAFYAILALAGMMFISTFHPIPEAVTGLVGAALIGLAFWSSLRWNRANPEGAVA